MIAWIWILPLLPLAGFLINGLFGARLPSRQAIGWIACGTVLLAFLVSLGAILGLGDLAGLAATAPPGVTIDLEAHRVTQTYYTWIPLGRSATGESLEVSWAYTLDPLSAVMLLVVTGVGFLIHVYAVGYMGHEPQAGFARFFAYLNLFMAMMLTLVLGASLPVVFVGWEGVGLCSYLLIGYYYDRMFDEKTGMSCADAGRKAFITNRIGDTGFVLGMLLLFATTGTLDIQGILGQAGSLGAGVATAAGLLLFVGACGKSAQIPLYVWLPDAMAGPTPVSALIHAATMVTAGVYVTCRMAPLYLASPTAMAVVATVGALTALLAAIIGTAQDDIKKVLAYSTVSQLGYMMLAAGVGAFSAAIFHLMTHAFFKALLFLGAGSVIHALSGEQDIRKMGGLRGHLPVTHATFLIAVLAIAGVPPLAGFFSKDEILWAAASGPGGSLLLWVVGVVTAGLTAFYMARLYLLVFSGSPRLTADARHHLHESPAVMTVPLAILAVGSALVGFLGVPHFLGGDRLPNHFEHYLAPVFHAAPAAAPGPAAMDAAHASDAAQAAAPVIHSAPPAVRRLAALGEWTAMIVALAVSGAGILVAWLVFGRGRVPAAAQNAVARLVRGKFFVDEAIDAVVLAPWRGLCRVSAAFDETIVDGMVNASATVTDLASQALRMVQTGYVRNYAFVFFLGTIAILYYVLR